MHREPIRLYRSLLRLLTALALLALVAQPLVGCSQAPASGGDANKPILIGGTLSLTGVWAETAKQIRNGYELWAADVNNRGGLLGRKVELRILDDEAKPDKAVQILEKLMTVDKVDLLLGAYPATTISAQAPIAEKYKYIYVGMGAHGPSFQQGYQYFFGGPPLMMDWFPLGFLGWLKDMRDKAAPADKPQTVGIISLNNVIGQSGRNGAKAFIEKNMPDMKIVVDESHDSPLTNAEPLIAKVKQAQADVLLINSAPAEVTLLLRTLKVQGYQPKIIFTAIGPQSLEWVKEMGDMVDNAFTGFTGDANTARAKEVDKMAQSTLNKPASLYVLAGYNYGSVLEAAVNGTKSLDNTKLRDYLKANEIDTALGKMKFNTQGLPQETAYGYQVQKDKVVLVFPKGTGAAEAVYPVPRWK